MGSYLSEPITEKVSADEENDKYNCGHSSMQGWRVSQEDAHNCILDFDTNAALFAVYDGHGGEEVAKYTAQTLPDFLKNTDAYKKGDFETALVDAFLGFDATLAKEEVIKVLKEIAGVKDDKEDDSDAIEESVDNLYEEAAMPLEKVIQKYEAALLPGSDLLKKKKKKEEAGSSGLAACSSSSSTTSNAEANGSSSTKAESSSSKSEETSEVKNGEENIPDTKKSVAKEEKTDSNGSDNKSEEKESHKNGDIVSADSDKSKSTPQENGQSPSPKGKGKALVKTKGMKAEDKPKRELRPKIAAHLYNALLNAQDGSDEDSEDDEDVTFEGPESDDDDSEAGDKDGEDSENEDEEDDDDEEEEDDDEDDELNEQERQECEEFARSMREEPGSDSGCTAVVALVHGTKLYVANAGDSRCVVSRKGTAVEMSFDHKPEDEPERERVVKAGGKVTGDGRVNGGLNLSRAIGDHAYKQNKELSDREQMITALPDIKTLDINPAEDEFMVLACDGIWNFMSSQEVIDFVRPRLQENNCKLSQICEEMFEHCLAPNTMGDGTGCDNMTAIIVQFKNTTLKRPATSEGEEENNSSCKRAKTDETTEEAKV